MSPNPRRMRRALVTGAVVAGASLGAAGVASAATSATTSPSSGSSSATAPSGSSAGTPPTGAPPAGTGGDPATMSHGPNETLLTGTDLQKATAAADAAVPGTTIIRAETNSSGGYPYEVHMKKSDGTDVTVELDSNFSVITTISRFGAGPTGSQGPRSAGGQAPSSGSSSTY